MAINQFDIQASGGDFTTLALWEDDRDTNGTTSTDIERAVLNAAESFAGCVVIGWTTRTGAGAIEITTASAYQHNGDVNSSVGGGQAVLTTTINLAEFQASCYDCFMDSAGAGDNSFFLNFGGSVSIKRCICKNSTGAGFASQAAASTSFFENCIALNNNIYGFWTNGADAGKILSCLAYGSTNGFFVQDAANDYYTQIRNSIALNNTTDVLTGTHASTDVDYIIYNNASSSIIGGNSVSGASATASTSPGAGTWVGFTNITGGSEDFELITTDQTDHALGTAVTGTGVTDDILERARDGSTPDIGPFEQPVPAVVKIINESATISEDSIHARAIVKLVSELANLSESPLTLRTINKVINEIETATELIQTNRDLVRIVNEILNASEGHIVSRALVKIIDEAIIGAEAFGFSSERLIRAVAKLVGSWNTIVKLRGSKS